MYKIIVGSIFGLLLFSSAATAACTVTYTFTNGTTADATQVNQDFNDLTNCAAPVTSPTLSGAVGIFSNPSTFTNVYQLTNSGPTYGGAIAPQLAIADNNGTYAQFLLKDGNGSGGNSPTLGFANKNSAGNYILGISMYAAQSTSTAGSENQDLVFTTQTGGAATSEKVRFTGGGYVGIGTNAPGYMLTVNGTAYATGAAGALSDLRHKKEVSSLSSGALDNVMRLRPVTFLWRQPKDDGMKGLQMGFIAQDVEKVLPSVVLTENNAEKTKGLKYNELIAVLTKAMQEQQVEISQLKAANDNQSAKIADMRIAIGGLERRIGIRTAQK